MRKIIGIDIGGTKCAVSRLHSSDEVEEVVRLTTTDFPGTFPRLVDEIAKLSPDSDTIFGISCGGPLDSRTGRILSPPNLPGWDNIPITKLITQQFGGQAHLMNDANACALAEWHFGAGQGCRHLVFLTAGSGMGAGLILNGQLYLGASGDSGEVGHIRLANEGPKGFGKVGSFEGFCSGGGILRLATYLAAHKKQPTPVWQSAKEIAEAARLGNPLAREVMKETGRRLGQALAILIDTLNPERIIIGGMFMRCQDLLEAPMSAVLAQEALPPNRAACQIVPALLGEQIGNYGAISAALFAMNELGGHIRHAHPVANVLAP